jgi:hypothetical protein
MVLGRFSSSPLLRSFDWSALIRGRLAIVIYVTDPIEPPGFMVYCLTDPPFSFAVFTRANV